MSAAASPESALTPLHVFRFHVDFAPDPIGGTTSDTAVQMCSGAFSDCTGLEATMEPKVIKEGGHNHGPHQRVGPVTYSTVILKRGMTSTRDLWKWFELVAGGGYSYRLAVTITMFDTTGQGVLGWKLEKAFPTKFKSADLNARGAEIGIEELHIAHQGITFVSKNELKRKQLA